MIKEFQSSPEISEDAPVATGEQLKQAREAQGHSIEDTAARLNISAKYIRALEASDIGSLPRMPFVRGYIRSYARLLGLSGDQLVVSFNQEFAGDDVQQVATINKVGSQVKLSDPWMRSSVYLFFLAVLGISIWWWQTQSGNSLSDLINFNSVSVVEQVPDEQGGAEVTPEQLMADNDPSDIQARLAAREEQLEQQIEVERSSEQEPQYLSAEQIQTLTQQLEKKRSDDTTSAQEESQLQAVTEVAEVQGSLAPAPMEEVVAAAVIAEVAAPDTSVKPVGMLRLSFVGDCWVSIRDASDKLIFAKTKRAGEVLELELETPANLLVGRVSAVQQARFNDADLDLPGLAKKDMARVVLK
ncbi:MAG: RodZ domain-containing protein [Motiliproteus sp.]